MAQVITLDTVRIMGRPARPNPQVTQTPRRERAARLLLPPMQA